jgi:ribosomal protein S18 acetylase RimI-like enzyme
MEGSAPPSKLRIRPAIPADIPAVFRMKRDLAVAEGNEGILRATERDWLRDGFGAAARFRCFVAAQGAALIGMVTYSETYMTALGGPIFTIQDLYVAPGRRKLGAGRALLAEVAAAALKEGVPLIELSVLDSNPARKFYRRLGFRHLAECLTYAVGGEPMLALAMPLADAAAAPR